MRDVTVHVQEIAQPSDVTSTYLLESQQQQLHINAGEHKWDRENLLGSCRTAPVNEQFRGLLYEFQIYNCSAPLQRVSR